MSGDLFDPERMRKLDADLTSEFGELHTRPLAEDVERVRREGAGVLVCARRGRALKLPVVPAPAPKLVDASSPLASFLDDPEDDRRQEDLRMLRLLVEEAPRADEEDFDRRPRAEDGLATNEVEAFADMQRRLEDEGQKVLTEKQRAWVARRFEELGLEDPAVLNARVPRGREVEAPAVLRDLPKRPPGRR